MDKLYPRYFPLIEVGDGIRMAMIPTDDAKVIRTTCKYYLSESPLHTYRLIANGRDEEEEFDVCCPYCNSVMSPITIIGDIKLVTYVCEQCNFRDLNRKKENQKR